MGSYVRPNEYHGVLISTPKSIASENLESVTYDILSNLDVDFTYDLKSGAFFVSSKKDNLDNSTENTVSELFQNSVKYDNVFTRDSNPTYFNETSFYNSIKDVSDVINSSVSLDNKNNEISTILNSESFFEYKKGFSGFLDSSNSSLDNSYSTYHFSIDKPKSSLAENYGITLGTFYHTTMFGDLGSYFIERYINGSKYGWDSSGTLKSSTEYHQLYRTLSRGLLDICNSRNKIVGIDGSIVPPPKPPDKRIPTTCCILVECYPTLYKYPWEV